MPSCAGCSRIAHFRCEAKALKAQLSAFGEGGKYVALRKDTQRQLAAKDREVKKLKRDTLDAERRIVDMRESWMQVYDVNYDGTVKGLAFVLGSYCCVPSCKIVGLLPDLTKGQLKISNGMINGLCKEFSEKTTAERKSRYTKTATISTRR